MLVLGMISGTSQDGIDTAVVEFTDGPDGILTARIVDTDLVAYDAELRRRLERALPPQPCTADELCQLDTLVGQAFAGAAAAAAERVGGVDLICSHGQTVYHWVSGGAAPGSSRAPDSSKALGTLQIGQPAWLAETVGAPVVSDVRARDLAAGGHGAPLVPILDEFLLAGTGEPAAALNLGGIANMTVVTPGRPSLAYDLGPANALIDAVVRDRGLNGLGYDADGRIAAAGRVDEALLGRFLADPYYALPAPKSTGKEHFHLGHVQQHLDGASLDDADLVATLTRLTAQVVAAELVGAGVARVFASGGGVRNPVLMDTLAELAPGVRIAASDELGVPAADKEAIAFALIGWCSWHGLPGNVTAATGAAGPRVLGSITPGREPLRLPEPRDGLAGLRFEPSGQRGGNGREGQR